MKTRFALVVLLSFSLTACHYYKEYDKDSFPTYTWKSGQEIKFHPSIDDVTKSYQLTIGIRHLFGFQPGSIGIRVKSISPSGKETIRDYDFRIRDANHEYLASCGGDLCDLETVVEESIRFDEAGQYTYVLSHTMNADKIPGVMELGLILDKMD